MSPISARAYLADYARACEPRLREFLDRKGERLASLPVDLRGAHALLRDYALRGGKRIRGALVMLGNEAAGGSGVLDASVGIELLHAYLLIHDDFMDRDQVRRGGPTLHASLAKSAGEHIGGSVAILLGSLCQAWAVGCGHKFRSGNPPPCGLHVTAIAVTKGQRNRRATLLD